MEPITGALTASAISSALGSIGGILGSKKSAKSAKKNLQAQILWEQTKATNAHQWEMQDLKKAGLNPALTAMGGQGANVGSITPQMPDTSGYANSGNTLTNNVKQLMNYTQDLKRTNNETAKTKSEIANIEADTAIKEINAGIATKTGLKEAEERINNLKTASAKNLADADTLQNAIGKGIKPLGETVGQVLGGIKNGISFFGKALGRQLKKSMINSAKKHSNHYDYQKPYPQL